MGGGGREIRGGEKNVKVSIGIHWCSIHPYSYRQKHGNGRESCIVFWIIFGSDECLMWMLTLALSLNTAPTLRSYSNMFVVIVFLHRPHTHNDFVLIFNL